MFFKVKPRKTDTLFTKYMRLKYNYECVKCSRVYPPDNCRNLGVSHYFTRGKESTRFDEDNCDLLCTLPCHRKWGHGDERGDYIKYMIKKLGQEGLDLLELRSNTYKKRDDVMDKIILDQMLKELEDGS